SRDRRSWRARWCARVDGIECDTRSPLCSCTERRVSYSPAPMPSDSVGPSKGRSRASRPSASKQTAARTRKAGSGSRSTPAREPDWIEVRGAAEHNLKIEQLRVPKRQLVVFTGVSGSGKSSLAFDTLYAEGQRRYIESLSAYARQFLGQLERPRVEHISGLSPTIAIEQKAASNNPRSTVGTITEIYDYLRVLFARVGV